VTAAEYAQALSDHAELVAKAEGLEGAQAIVLVETADGRAVAIGTQDGQDIAMADLLVALLDAASEIARTGWTVSAVQS
jgi:hypothetical protein